MLQKLSQFQNVRPGDLNKVIEVVNVLGEMSVTPPLELTKFAGRTQIRITEHGFHAAITSGSSSSSGSGDVSLGYTVQEVDPAPNGGWVFKTLGRLVSASEWNHTSDIPNGTVVWVEPFGNDDYRFEHCCGTPGPTPSESSSSSSSVNSSSSSGPSSSSSTGSDSSSSSDSVSSSSSTGSVSSSSSSTGSNSSSSSGSENPCANCTGDVGTSYTGTFSGFGCSSYNGSWTFTTSGETGCVFSGSNGTATAAFSLNTGLLLINDNCTYTLDPGQSCCGDITFTLFECSACGTAPATITVTAHGCGSSSSSSSKSSSSSSGSGGSDSSSSEDTCEGTECFQVLANVFCAEGQIFKVFKSYRARVTNEGRIVFCECGSDTSSSSSGLSDTELHTSSLFGG